MLILKIVLCSVCKLNGIYGIEGKFPERFVKNQYLDLDQAEEKRQNKHNFQVQSLG